jgi:hypothetical protein
MIVTLFTLHSTLGRGPCLGQQRIGRLAQAEAGQSLTEVGKVDWQLCLI